MNNLKILHGDCIEQMKQLPDESIQTCITSPPYWGLRNYGEDGQIGLESTPQEFIAKIVEVFREVKRLLKKDGTLWLNLGDSYAGSGRGTGDNLSNNSSKGVKIGSEHGQSGHTSGVRAPKGFKVKDLIMIPARTAIALQEDGWYLRSDIIWNKPACMPESVTDRPTNSHEHIFLLAKSKKYYYDAESIKEKAVDGSPRNDPDPESRKRFPTEMMNGMRDRTKTYEMRNKRNIWTVSTVGYSDAHFATYPPELIKPCVLAGSKAGDTILDPFGGSGTTGMVALEFGRNAILIELNAEYIELIKNRCNVTPGLAL